MKTMTRRGPRGSGRATGAGRTAAASAAAIVLAVGAHPAVAALGGTLDSVEADRAHMRAAAVAGTQTDTWAAHALTLPSGGMVKEFTTKAGVVFALSWIGPGRPDLRQLLGEQHFADFQLDNGVRRGARTRRAMVTARSDLVVHSEGRPGAFSGVAYVPSLVPAGFSAADMQQVEP